MDCDSPPLVSQQEPLCHDENPSRISRSTTRKRKILSMQEYEEKIKMKSLLKVSKDFYIIQDEEEERRKQQKRIEPTRWNKRKERMRSEKEREERKSKIREEEKRELEREEKGLKRFYTRKEMIEMNRIIIERYKEKKRRMFAITTQEERENTFDLKDHFIRIWLSFCDVCLECHSSFREAEEHEFPILKDIRLSIKEKRPILCSKNKISILSDKNGRDLKWKEILEEERQKEERLAVKRILEENKEISEMLGEESSSLENREESGEETE